MDSIINKNIKPHLSDNIVGGKCNFNPKPSLLIRHYSLHEIEYNLMKIEELEYDELFHMYRKYSNTDTIHNFYNMHSTVKWEASNYTYSRENVFVYSGLSENKKTQWEW